MSELREHVIVTGMGIGTELEWGLEISVCG